MKKFRIAAILSILVISGCTPNRRGGGSSSTSQESSSSEPTSAATSELSTSQVVTSAGTSSEQISSTSASSSQISSISQSTSITSAATSSPTSTITSAQTSQSSTTSQGTSQSSDITDLGKQKISYIVKYINDHPITVPSGKKGAVDEKTIVTFDGLALEHINLIKTKAKFGLDVSYPNKIIFGDDTGYIGVASNDSPGDLYPKVKDHVGKETSKYTITGYLSVYLDHPEIVVTSFKLDSSLSVTCDPKTISTGNSTFQEFFENARDVNYNCAGHGYGEVYTFNHVTSYHWYSSSSSTKIAYITDGEKLIKTIGHNRPNITEGKVFNIVGIISMLNYAPALYVLSVEELFNESPVSIDADAIATNETIDQLRTVKASQDDTERRYPDYTMFWSGIYKTTGYLTTCEEGGTNYYIGIRDTYYDSGTYINGKINAMTTYKMALIDNDYFWNTTPKQFEFNPYCAYIDENESVTVYYIPQQLDYSDGKTCWKIFLLPSTFNPH